MTMMTSRSIHLIAMVIALIIPLSTSFQQISIVSSSVKHPIFARQSRIQVYTRGFHEENESDCAVDTEDTVPRIMDRRKALGLNLGTLFMVASFTSSNPQVAKAAPPPNPLNLKGSFWETGTLYQKSDVDLPSDPEELLSSLTQIANAMDSLSDVASEGRFGDLSRMLRGGVISESQLRLNAYALIDTIVDEDMEYKASELFRRFLRDFEVLDAVVDSASRKTKLDGGMVETIGRAVVSPLGAANEMARISGAEPAFSGADVRIDVLAALGTTTKVLKEFNKVAKDAIQTQK